MDLKFAKQNFEGKPGSVFVHSWGYDQTNVDCYQMVKRQSESLIIAVEVGLATVDGSEGMMSCSVLPVPLTQEEAEAVVKAGGGLRMFIRGTQVVKIPGKHGGQAGLWDGKRDYYNSWYA